MKKITEYHTFTMRFSYYADDDDDDEHKNDDNYSHIFKKRVSRVLSLSFPFLFFFSFSPKCPLDASTTVSHMRDATAHSSLCGGSDTGPTEHHLPRLPIDIVSRVLTLAFQNDKHVDAEAGDERKGDEWSGSTHLRPAEVCKEWKRLMDMDVELYARWAVARCGVPRERCFGVGVSGASVSPPSSVGYDELLHALTTAAYRGNVKACTNLLKYISLKSPESSSVCLSAMRGAARGGCWVTYELILDYVGAALSEKSTTELYRFMLHGLTSSEDPRVLECLLQIVLQNRHRLHVFIRSITRAECQKVMAVATLICERHPRLIPLIDVFWAETSVLGLFDTSALRSALLLGRPDVARMALEHNRSTTNGFVMLSLWTECLVSRKLDQYLMTKEDGRTTDVFLDHPPTRAMIDIGAASTMERGAELSISPLTTAVRSSSPTMTMMVYLSSDGAHADFPPHVSKLLEHTLPPAFAVVDFVCRRADFAFRTERTRPKKRDLQSSVADADLAETPNIGLLTVFRAVRHKMRKMMRSARWTPILSSVTNLALFSGDSHASCVQSFHAQRFLDSYLDAVNTQQPTSISLSAKHERIHDLAVLLVITRDGALLDRILHMIDVQVDEETMSAERRTCIFGDVLSRAIQELGIAAAASEENIDVMENMCDNILDRMRDTIVPQRRVCAASLMSVTTAVQAAVSRGEPQCLSYIARRTCSPGCPHFVGLIQNSLVAAATTVPGARVVSAIMDDHDPRSKRTSRRENDRAVELHRLSIIVRLLKTSLQSNAPSDASLILVGLQREAISDFGFHFHVFSTTVFESALKNKKQDVVRCLMHDASVPISDSALRHVVLKDDAHVTDHLLARMSFVDNCTGLLSLLHEGMKRGCAGSCACIRKKIGNA